MPSSNPFADPQHPAGYGLIVRRPRRAHARGRGSRLLQHLVGIASALLPVRGRPDAWRGPHEPGSAGARRSCCCNLDQIFLEHVDQCRRAGPCSRYRSRSYAVVRAPFDGPDRWWRWPTLAGGARRSVSRSARRGLLAIPSGRPRAVALPPAQPFAAWRRRWQAPVAAAGRGGGGPARLRNRQRRRSAIASGSVRRRAAYLYGRAAQFADCDRFEHPHRGRRSCARTPPTSVGKAPTTTSSPRRRRRRARRRRSARATICRSRGRRRASRARPGLPDARPGSTGARRRSSGPDAAPAGTDLRPAARASR